MKTKWVLAPSLPKEAVSLFPDVHPLVAQLLWNRGIRRKNDWLTFLTPDFKRDIHDPFLFRDMRRATSRIAAAISDQELIIIHGDYDADGICATALLFRTLKLFNANVDAFIPHRELDGYGLRDETIDILARRGARLIITCDCGISNSEEIHRGAARNIDVIITDHHTIPQTLPNAFAIIHPKIEGETYPDKGLSGGGVAFKLASALLQSEECKKFLPNGINTETFLKWQIDLAAISSVADMVPLTGETRTLVHYGCIVLSKTRNIGLRALIQRTRSAIVTPETIAFHIAPRINSAGRMDHARLAFELLTTDDTAAADRLADCLNTHNTNRQKLVERIIADARSRIIRDGLHESSAIVISGENWPAGILGLVAGKIKDEFYKPAFVIGINSGRIIGSGRSIENWNMISALQTAPELFEKFGGHPQACGFTLSSAEMIPKFETKMCALATAASTQTNETAPITLIDARINLRELTWDMWSILSKFEPFGVGNPEPKFLAEAMELVAVAPVGANNKHARLMVRIGSAGKKKIMAFGIGERISEFLPGAMLNGILSFGAREWNGIKELEYKLHDYQII